MSSVSQATRRILTYLSGALGVMVALAFVYQWGMAAFEGADVEYAHALYVVVETFTTTGFGLDADQWDSDRMLTLMMVFQLVGVGLIFLALPAIVIPLVGEALSSSPPTGTELTGHVVLCSFTPRGETLVRELDARDQPYVVVEPDRERAGELAADHDVVHGDPEDVETLRAANAGAGRRRRRRDERERRPLRAGGGGRRPPRRQPRRGGVGRRLPPLRGCRRGALPAAHPRREPGREGDHHGGGRTRRGGRDRRGRPDRGTARPPR